jgi:hypothetical protein
MKIAMPFLSRELIIEYFFNPIKLALRIGKMGINMAPQG